MNTDKRAAVGLDFGTSTTLVASANGIVPIGDSYPWMPSVVGFADDGSIVAGEPATELVDDQAVWSIKRAITDGRRSVRMDTATGDNDVWVDDLIVEILREAARRAAARGQDVTGSAIRLGCPAMWEGRQRRRLEELARRAGLEVSLANLIDEPVAAGIAWLAGNRLEITAPLRVLVFDMGGGTLDVAVLTVRGQEFSVLSALGVAEAGDSLDHAIAEDLEWVIAAAGVDVDSLGRPRRARERLAHAARAAKVALTDVEVTDVKLPRRDFGIASVPYSRDQLNQVFAPQMDRAEQFVLASLRAARLTEHNAGSIYDIARAPIETLVADVDVVVLSGGMSQVPYVAQRMRELFGARTRIEAACSPSENAVALGLALAPRYGGINMHRPGFDIMLEWDAGQETRYLYEAYTPLIEPWQIAQGAAELRYVRTGMDLSLPDSGTGRMRVVSHSADRVRATIAGVELDGFPVALSEQKFEFSIYADGRIRLTDGAATYDGKVGNWSAG